jgi:hypothetical protein
LAKFGVLIPFTSFHNFHSTDLLTHPLFHAPSVFGAGVVPAFFIVAEAPASLLQLGNAVVEIVGWKHCFMWASLTLPNETIIVLVEAHQNLPNFRI